MGAQAGNGVMDVVDSEHDAMQAQRVGRRPRPAAGRRRGVVPGQLQLAVAVRGPHHRDLAPDAVESDGAVCKEAFDLSLAFQFHAELGEERHGGVQVVDDDGNVVHPLNGHVSEHMTAASRQCGVEGPGGSVGLKVMPIDSVTLSDGHDPGERAPTRLICVVADPASAGLVRAEPADLSHRGSQDGGRQW